MRLVVVLLVAAIIASLAIKLYAAPALIGWEIRKDLQESWRGEVEVGLVEFNYLGPVIVHGLTLRDNEGETWLTTGRLRAEVAGWPGLRPKVTQLTLDRPVVTAHIHKPLPLVSPAGEPSELLDIRHVMLANGSVIVRTTDGLLCHFTNVRLSANDQGGQWRMQLTFDEGDNSFVITGRAEETVGDNGSRQTNFVGGAALPDGRADITIALQRHPDQPDRRLAASTNISIEAFQGRASLLASAIVPTEGPPRLKANLAAKDMDLRPLMTLLRFDRPTDGRLVSLQVDASLASASLDDVKANGLIFLDDMTVLPNSILRTVLDAISPRSASQESSDLQAVFSLTGPAVTIHSGGIGGDVIALDVQPGGKIDLSTHALDGVVVAVLMKDISNILSALPMIGIVSDLSSDLTRSRVTGTWDDPVITPLPMADMPAHTLSFLQTLSSSGGQFGGLMFLPMRELFEALPAINGNATPRRSR